MPLTRRLVVWATRPHRLDRKRTEVTQIRACLHQPKCMITQGSKLKKIHQQKNYKTTLKKYKLS